MNFVLFGREIHIKKIAIAGAIVFVAAALLTIGIFSSRGGDSIVIEKESDGKNVSNVTSAKDTDIKVTDEQSDSKSEEDKIKVYVVGCVKKPGIVTLNKGQIIYDAINAAGGATEEADVNNINMAYVLNENVMLKVKSKKEAQQALKAATVQKPAVSASQPQNSSGIEIVKDSGGVVANEVVIAAKSDGKININTATIKELDSLSGIGESIAQDIIDYREKNGGFKSINDIMKVAGIKEKTFNKIKDRITVK